MRTVRTQRPAPLVRQLGKNKKSVDDKNRAHASRPRRVRTFPPANRGMGGARQVPIFSEQVWGLVLGRVVADAELQVQANILCWSRFAACLHKYCVRKGSPLPAMTRELQAMRT